MRTYVVVRGGAVQDVPAGVFYYDPMQHQLISAGLPSGAESAILDAANFSAYDGAP